MPFRDRFFYEHMSSPGDVAFLAKLREHIRTVPDGRYYMPHIAGTRIAVRMMSRRLAPHGLGLASDAAGVYCYVLPAPGSPARVATHADTARSSGRVAWLVYALGFLYTRNAYENSFLPSFQDYLRQRLTARREARSRSERAVLDLVFAVRGLKLHYDTALWWMPDRLRQWLLLVAVLYATSLTPIGDALLRWFLR